MGLANFTHPEPEANKNAVFSPKQVQDDATNDSLADSKSDGIVVDGIFDILSHIIVMQTNRVIKYYALSYRTWNTLVN